jgi:hypothetical protein
MKTNIYIYRSILLRMRNTSDNSCRENHKTFFVDKLSLENRTVYEIMWKNKEKDDNMDMRT